MKRLEDSHESPHKLVRIGTVRVQHQVWETFSLRSQMMSTMLMIATDAPFVTTLSYLPKKNLGDEGRSIAAK